MVTALPFLLPFQPQFRAPRPAYPPERMQDPTPEPGVVANNGRREAILSRLQNNTGDGSYLDFAP